MKRPTLAAIALLAAGPARAEQIRCTAPGVSPVTVALKARRYALTRDGL